jgi:hypothetical protein
MPVLLRRLLREPLVHFLIAGCAVYLVHRTLAPAPVDTISVSREVQLAIVQLEEELRGRSLSDEERAAALAAYVDDEVLLREAYRRGYDRSVARVRKQLLTVMRSMLDEPVPEPSRAQLEAYYREQGERYAPGLALTLDIVAYLPGDAEAPADLASFQALLAGGADFTQLGARGMMAPPPTLVDATRDRLRLSFGGTFFDEAVAVPDGEWGGPIDTAAGRHFVRPRSRRVLTAPDFDEMEQYLRQEYMFERRREIQQRKIDDMRAGYRIVIEGELP